MKVKVFPQDDGLLTIFVKRNLPSENPSRAIRNVKPEDRERAIDQLVREVRGEVTNST